MAETNETLLNIVNTSGFLFQLRVEHEIRQVVQKYYSDWSIPVREHRWIDPPRDEEFIDLVLQSGIGRMVIECKRLTDAQWLFLIPDNQSVTQQARLYWTDRIDGFQDMSEWGEFTILPESPESSFCTTRGQGETDQPMLERVASTLLRSVESLANEELTLGQGTVLLASRIYLPIIVTTATLKVCRFQTDQIDLSTGKLDTNNATLDTVPLIRFRKNLSTTTAPIISPNDLAKANTENERTVFIINAMELSNTLREWKIVKFGAQWPWEKARSLEETVKPK